MYRARCTVHSSVCSMRMAPTSRRMEASLGKIPTTSVLRLISPFRCPAVVCLQTTSAGVQSDSSNAIWSDADGERSCRRARPLRRSPLSSDQWRTKARSISPESLGNLPRIWSATLRHWIFAVAWSGCAKAETTRRLLLPACARAFLWKCTRQRCQLVFSTRATEALMPSCASLMTSFTPRRPRRARSRRNSVQKGEGDRRPSGAA